MLNEHEIMRELFRAVSFSERIEDVGIVKISPQRWAIAVFGKGGFIKLGDGPAARDFPEAKIVTSPTSLKTAHVALGMIQSQLGYKMEKAERP